MWIFSVAFMRYTLTNSDSQKSGCLLVNKGTQWFYIRVTSTSVRTELFWQKAFISLESKTLHVLQVSFIVLLREVSMALDETPTGPRACQHDRQPCCWSRAFKSQILRGMKCFAELKMNLLTSLKSSGRQPAVTIHLQSNLSSVQGRFLWHHHQSVISATICYF